MKLKDGMVLGHVDGEDFAIATGKAMKHFNGVIHNNPTAAILFELLQTEQTEDSLVAILTEEEAKELVDHLLTTWRRSRS